MEKQSSKRRIKILAPIAGALVLVVLLWLATVVVAEPLARRLDAESANESATAIVPPHIFYQGRLNDAAGDPITGTYVMTFSLYTQLSGGTSIATDPHSVSVKNGLFRTYIGFPAQHYNGQTLFVGVQVEGDAEMEPRHYLRPVPYALSLRPGAVISGAVAAGQPALKVVNTGAGNAVRGANDSAAAAAVAGVNVGAGPGGYFSSAGDYALQVDGDLFVNGTVWARNYDNVTVVAKSGGDYTSIQAALDSITDAAEDNAYLVRVMPGVYEEQVTLKSHVTVQGSGWRLTVISKSIQAGAVEGADDSVLSNLRVINTGANLSSAIRNDSVDNVSIEGVVVQASGISGSFGIYNTQSSVEIRDSIVIADGADANYGIYANGPAVEVDISNSFISADGGDEAHAVYNKGGSDMSLEGCTLKASSSVTDAHVYGVGNYDSGTVLTVTNTTIEAEALGSDAPVYGVSNESSATATLEGCTIRARGDNSSTYMITGVGNLTTSTLTLKRSAVYVDGVATYGLRGSTGASTSVWFSEVHATGSNNAWGVVSQVGAPFDLHYSTVSATGSNADGIFTNQASSSVPTEILIQGGKISGDDYAIENSGSNTSYTIKVIEAWLEGTVDTVDTYICLGAHDGTNYLSATCQP